MYRTVIATLILLCTSVPAWAAPVTDGFIRTSLSEDFWALYSMTGPDFSLHCTAIRTCGVLTDQSIGRIGSGPPGTPVSLDSQWSITASPFSASSNLVLNGTAYRAHGTLEMTVGQALRAPMVTAPFTMAGNLDLLHPETRVDLGDFTLTGSGTVTATFGSVGSLNSIRFDFTTPPGNGGGAGVIPEPSTALLVASGLAGIGLWRRRESTQRAQS